MSYNETWTPPRTPEEWLWGTLVPPRLVTWYNLRHELTRGERELSLVPFLVQRDRIAVDAGANRGIWSEMMRRYARHVHAFEPNPKLYEELRRGAAKGVTPHRLALSNETGTAELRIPKRQQGYSNYGASLSEVAIGSSTYKSITVRTARLDDLDLGDVGFIKIDVEGHESAVIDGAKETLRKYRPNLIVELEERHTHRPIYDLLAEVNRHGYEAFALYRGAVRPVSQLNLEEVHINRRPKRGYIFNWIFFPL